MLLGICCICLLSSFNQTGKPSTKPDIEKPQPKIINIVNFIRLLEPRYPAITEEVLYQTVVKQVELMKKYNLMKNTILPNIFILLQKENIIKDIDPFFLTQSFIAPFFMNRVEVALFNLREESKKENIDKKQSF